MPDELLAKLGEFKPRSGRGGALLVAEEPGTTDITEEAARLLEQKGYQVLSGRFLEHSPVSAFEAALGPDHAHLFREERPPKVMAAYVIAPDSGLLVSKCQREESDIDPDIFSGMLTAVGSFVKDSLRQLEKKDEAGLKLLEYGDYNIVIEPNPVASVALILSGTPTGPLRLDLGRITRGIVEDYGTVLKGWSGERAKVEEVDGRVGWFFNSKKYEGELPLEKLKSAQDEIKEKILRAIERLSSERPVALILKDLHLADPFSVELLAYAARGARNKDIVLIGTYEKGALEERLQNQALQAALEGMAGEGLCGRLERKADRGLLQILAQKLEKADAGDLKLLSYAALAGFEIDGKVLARAAGIGDDELSKALKKFAAAGLLIEERKEEEAHYRFHNRRIQATILERLEDTERACLDVAKAMEQVHADRLAEHSEKLAALYRTVASTNPIIREKAIHYSVEAAGTAVMSRNYERALENYKAALALDENDGRKLGVLENIVKIEGITSRHDEKIEHCAQLEEIAAREGDVRRQAIARRGTAATHVDRRQLREALQDLEVALELFQAAGDLGGVANVYCGMCGVFHYKGDYQEALKYAKLGLEKAWESGSLREIAVAHGYLASSYFGLKMWDEAERANITCLGIFEELGELANVAIAYNNLAYMFSEKGDYGKALDYGEKSRVVCEEIGTLDTLVKLLNTMADIHLRYTGDLGKAGKAAEAALQCAERIGDQVQQAVAHTNLADISDRECARHLEQAERLIAGREETTLGKQIIQEIGRLRGRRKEAGPERPIREEIERLKSRQETEPKS